MSGKHVIECFVHEDEGENSDQLIEICDNRARKHAQNVLRLLFDNLWLQEHAGCGLRQGFPDAGPIKS
jgi:riboflavin synthase